MNLSGDANKSIIFTCGLGFLSGSEVLLCVCPICLGILACHPLGSPAILRGENDQFGNCQPGAAICLGTYLLLVENSPPVCSWLYPSAQRGETPRTFSELPYSLTA